MADENEDQWLYGDSVDAKETSGGDGQSEIQKDDASKPNEQEQRTENDENAEDKTDGPSAQQSTEDAEDAAEGPAEPSTNGNDEPGPELNGKDPKEVSTNPDDPEAPSDSDSDDDVHVVIGDIKSTPAYGNLNIKRGGLLTTTSGVPDKLTKQPGKFSIDEFETIGVINGMPAHEFNLDQLEDKPWRQPGADITDYFNYGFNEETWRAYCERQKRMRSESGVGLVLNAGGNANNPGGGGGGGGIGGMGGGGLGGCGIGSSNRIPPIAITNDNSKYSGIMGPKRAGPPPGRKMAGTIDVIGSSGLASRRNLDKSPPKENIIQVMTADRREYSRKPGFPDMSVPPPVPVIPPAAFDMPPPGYPGEPPPFYIPETDPYYQSYEPTQDSQWGNDPTWQPTNLAIPMTEIEEDKDSTPKTIPTMVPPISIPPLMPPREQRDSRDREREQRERERPERLERDVESVGRERERERERGEREKESVVREREREKDSVVREDDRERERSRSQYRHKERHRHRSRSRSRRHKSRSRSPSRRKKKSRRSDRERSKEESE